MRARLLLPFLLLITLPAICQVFPATSAFDSTATPPETYHALDVLAAEIKETYPRQDQRLFAIHHWVARNITYDKDSMYLINWRLGDDEAIAAATLRRRRGVCQNFATIFNALARRCGFECHVVDGFTMQGGRADRSSHAWVAVNLNERWSFCDPTWDKDDPATLRHYLVPPEIFISSHLPFDPMWQLLPYQVSVEDFTRGRTRAQTNGTYINYADSLKQYSLLTPLQQMEASYSRMKSFASASQLYRNQVAYVNMKIGIRYEEKDEQFYNLAVKDYNQATRQLNQYLTYRNNGFQPLQSLQAFAKDLEEVTNLIDEANKKIGKVGNDPIPNDAIDPTMLKSKLSGLKKRVEQEQAYLLQFFAARQKL